MPATRISSAQMAIISKVFPIVFGFISWGIPSGVVLYFFTSNLWQIGQQEVVLRTIGTAAGPPSKKGSKELESGSGSGSKTAVIDDAGPKKPGGNPKAKGSGSKPTTAKPSTGKPSAGKPSSTGTGKAGGKPGGTTNGNGQARGTDGARSNRKRKR